MSSKINDVRLRTDADSVGFNNKYKSIGRYKYNNGMRTVRNAVTFRHTDEKNKRGQYDTREEG